MSREQGQVDVLVGGFFGDEGKKATEHRMSSSGRYALSARYCGANNAGGSIYSKDGEKTVLSYVPAAVTLGVPGMLGSGVLLNPASAYEEIAGLKTAGFPVSPEDFHISDRATLIMPGDILKDQLLERTGDSRGTTKKGVAPAAGQKYFRRAPTAIELLRDPKRIEKLAIDGLLRALPAYSRYNYFVRRRKAKEAAEWIEQATELRPFISDTDKIVDEVLDSGNSILAVGTQGLGLSIESPDYPYVTSAHLGPAGAQIGLGVNHRDIGEVTAVIKATPSRVGDGPFPTEIGDPELAERLRMKRGEPGSEYGTVTGRPRRMGYPDFVKQGYLLKQHGVGNIVLTKGDCLRLYGDVISVALSYDDDGEPVYTNFPMDTSDISGARTAEELPEEVRDHIELYQEELGVKVLSIGVGPNEDQYITL